MTHGVITAYLGCLYKVVNLDPDASFRYAVALFELAKTRSDRVVLSIRENGQNRHVAEWRS